MLRMIRFSSLIGDLLDDGDPAMFPTHAPRNVTLKWFLRVRTTLQPNLCAHSTTG
jgi:hypothetical protein